MPRQQRNFSLVVEEADAFMNFLDDGDYEGVFKRNELKALYEGKFKEERKLRAGGYARVAYNFVFKELKARKAIHELGDYISFDKEVQHLYEQLLVSDEHKRTLEEWKKKAETNPNFCEFCGVDCESEKSFQEHQNGMRHRIHNFHYQLFKNRDQFLNCPSGIEIESPPVSEQTLLMEKESRPGNDGTFSLSIRNKNRSKTLIFRRHLLLWDTGVFKIVQKNKNSVRNNYHIPPGNCYDLLVKFKAPADFGHHFVPCAFYFDWKDDQNNLIEKDENTQEFVVRFVSVHVLGDLHEEMAPIAPFIKPKHSPDYFPEEIVEGVKPPESSKSVLSVEYKLSASRIPMYLKAQVDYGLTEPQKLPNNKLGKREIISKRLRRVLDCKLSTETYRSKFDTLLWIEELQLQEDIKRYDLLGVEIGFDRGKGLMVLKVPGLMERRPSVLRGDKVWIYLHDNRTTQYEAYVHRVELDHVHLGVGKKLKDRWVAGMKFDVRFDFNKFNFWVQHRALSDLKYAKSILFPSQATRMPMEGCVSMELRWYDKTLNLEQQQAVTNIVQGTSRPAPYIIFGPPGTGKTVTITEAIRQVYHCQPGTRILVCCPENTAADFVMCKLINTNQPGTDGTWLGDIYRMYAVSRQYASVPTQIKESKRLNYDEIDEDFYYPAKEELKKHRILIVTLSTAGRLVSAAFKINFFTHIFIDEGAHAVEPECIVPITGLLDARAPDCGQLVIAGDPKQLGPILRSQFSLNYGLDVSIIERFMDQFPEYQPKGSVYNPHFITKLVKNYRSHDAIIDVPRSLFYDGTLEACGDERILNAMLDWEHLPKKKFPVIFHAVFGKDERESTSPSFFNRDELSQVEKYLDLLLREQKGGLKIKPTDIGIISPYRKQVEKIRQIIAKKNYGKKGEIMVGSVEEFQGQERKVIIISTVRSNEKYVEIDMNYHLGFVNNPKRFNVALTRARSLLIVIGNPVVLENDENWKCFLDKCEEKGGFKGQHGRLKPYKSGKNAEICSGTQSMSQQTEDPPLVNRD